MATMNGEVKAKWIAALRSGEYEQGRNFLREEGSYCCLGVLCELHAKETGNEWTIGELYLGEKYFLPAEVQKWAGIDDRNPCFADKDGHASFLSDLNDAGRSFKWIANIIEENF